MRFCAFDVAGLVAVAGFAVVLGADLQGLRSSSREVEARLTDFEKAQGFRPGVSWFGLYLDDEKVGFARTARQRGAGGFSMHQDAVLDIEAFGSRQRIEIQMSAFLDQGFRLDHFDLQLTNAMLGVSVVGVVADQEMDLVVTVGDVEDRIEIAVDDRPFFDVAVNALVLNRDPRVGEVIELEVFDPFGLKPALVTVEYLGPEEVAVVDGAIAAHRLRRSVAGSILDVWVNDLGEVLREELPLGLLAIRETEASATWGFRQSGDERSERLALSPGLFGIFERDDVRGPAAP